MSANDAAFSGAIPELYDRLLTPMIFEPYAEDLAQRAAAHAPRALLETAAGTGVVSRALARALSSQARVTATDLNPPMLDLAQRRLADDPRFAWRQADAQALPFDDAAFDLVLCQFGVMFFPDRVAAYREAKRVLKPGGRFLFNVWGPIEDNEFAYEAAHALIALFPTDPPHFMQRTPHGYHDADAIRADLRAAGFETITVTPLAAQSAAPSPEEPAAAFCLGTPLRAEIETRGGSPEKAIQHVADALAKRFGGGAINGRMLALIVDAR